MKTVSYTHLIYSTLNTPFWQVPRFNANHYIKQDSRMMKSGNISVTSSVKLIFPDEVTLDDGFEVGDGNSVVADVYKRQILYLSGYNQQYINLIILSARHIYPYPLLLLLQ